MNRRHFFSSVAKVAACFAILPAATTYARRWVTLDSSVVVPVNEIWATCPFTQILQADMPRFHAMVIKEYVSAVTDYPTWLKV